MDGKSIINITDEYGRVIPMILLLSFELNGYKYIVYKEEHYDNLYAAKYQQGIEIDFTTDLSEKELNIVNQVYGELQNDNSK